MCGHQVFGPLCEVHILHSLAAWSSTSQILSLSLFLIQELKILGQMSSRVTPSSKCSTPPSFKIIINPTSSHGFLQFLEEWRADPNY